MTHRALNNRISHDCQKNYNLLERKDNAIE